MTPEARSVVEQYLREQEKSLLDKGSAIDSDPNLTNEGKKVLKRELKTALLKNGKAVQANTTGMATGESVLSALNTAYVEQMLFEGSFAKLASPSVPLSEQAPLNQLTGTELDDQQIVAPQYGANAAYAAQKQQEELDAVTAPEESVVIVSDPDDLAQNAVPATVAAHTKKPRAPRKKAPKAAVLDKPIDRDDQAVRSFFEEEYYQLRDTNKLARGDDGHAMGPDEYIVSKIAELDSLTPAGEVISIPDATQKEALTALQKSITAERERLSQEAIRMGAAQAQAANPLDTSGTSLTDVKTRLATLTEKLTGRAPDEGAPKLSASELYELRAKGIAEKHGLEDHFSEVRYIRQAYIDARSKLSGSISKERVARLKQDYDQALFGWRVELESKAGALSGPERSELLVVAKRDTILGPAHAEVEARERALTEKGKTTFGKVQNWMAKAPISVLKGLNWAPTKVGEGIAAVFNRNAYQPNKKMSPEKLREIEALSPKQREALSTAAQQDAARQYARAARIIAGAGIATLVTVAATPVVGIGGVLLPLVVFTARGGIGTLAGMGGAKLGGLGFDFFNRNRRENLKEFTTATPANLAEYQAQQEAYRKNNTKRRETEKMAVQMTSAMLTGAGTGILSSGVSHSILEHFGGLSSVKDAAKTAADVNAHSPGAGPEAMRMTAAMKAAAAHPAGGAHAPSLSDPAYHGPKMTASDLQERVGPRSNIDSAYAGKPVTVGSLKEALKSAHPRDAAYSGRPVSMSTLNRSMAEGMQPTLTSGNLHADAASNITDAVAKAAENVPNAASVPTAPEGLLTSVVINNPGEGFGQLLVDLRQHVSGLAHPPTGLKHFLEQNPNALTHRLGVAEDGGSLRMHAGDRLFVDAKQNVWLQAKGQDHPTLVFQKVPESLDAPDGYRVEHLDIKKFDGQLQPDTVRPHAPEVRTVSDAPSAPRAVSVPTEEVQVSASVPEAVTATSEQVVPQSVDTAGTLSTLHQPGTLDTDMPDAGPPAPDSAPEVSKPAVSSAPEQPATQGTVPVQGPALTETAPVDALPQELTPFTNAHGVNVVPSEPRVYALPGQRLVVWGTDSFQKQLDVANAFIDEQRELGKHVAVLVERTRENVFTGARETTMYEFSTDTEDAKIYPPDLLPFKPFGAKDFVPK